MNRVQFTYYVNGKSRRSGFQWSIEQGRTQDMVKPNANACVENYVKKQRKKGVIIHSYRLPYPNSRTQKFPKLKNLSEINRRNAAKRIYEPLGPYGPRGRASKCDPYDTDIAHWDIWETEKWEEFWFDQVSEIYFCENGSDNILVQMAQPKMNCFEEPEKTCDSFRLCLESLRNFLGDDFEKVRSVQVIDLCVIPGDGTKDLGLLTDIDYPHLREQFLR